MLQQDNSIPYQSNGTLDQLAYQFAQQPQQPVGPDNSAIIPGMGLNVTPPNKQAMLGNYLQKLGTQHVQNQQQQRGKQFLKGVHDVMAANMPAEDRINKLIALKSQHGTDYGLGLDDILTQIGKQSDSKKNDGWKPQTQQEALDFEAAKYGQKPESVGDKKFNLELQDRERASKANVEYIIASANETLSTIDEIEKGMNNFGLGSMVPTIPGSGKANWEANVNKLTSGKIIELIKTMKDASRTGSTGFGALSEKELAVLDGASTALKKNLNPKDAQKYLNQIKESAKKILNKQGVDKAPSPAGNIQLPQGITHTSQAIQFLMTQGMNQAQAIDYLNQMNMQEQGQ